LTGLFPALAPVCSLRLCSAVAQRLFNLPTRPRADVLIAVQNSKVIQKRGLSQRARPVSLSDHPAYFAFSRKRRAKQNCPSTGKT
jgi:hypothetical protein